MSPGTSGGQAPAGAVFRPAARVICVAEAGRILLLRWRDTVDNVTFWEPPGGGVEAGETPLEAARRELTEETGLPGAQVTERFVVVHRRFRWLGTCYAGDEPFFVAHFAGTPQVVPASLTPQERDRLLGHSWLHPRQLAGLAEPVEPAGLAGVLRSLGVA